MDLFILYSICAMTAAVAAVIYSPSFSVAKEALDDGTIGSDIQIRASNFRADIGRPGPDGYIQHD